MNSLFYPISAAATTLLVAATVTLCKKDVSKLNTLVILPLVMAAATDAFMNMTEAYGYLGAATGTGAFLGCAFAVIAGVDVPSTASKASKVFWNMLPMIVGTFIGFYFGSILHLANRPHIDVYMNGVNLRNP